MDEESRDPLAEHPLGPDPARKKQRLSTLPLFDIADAPIEMHKEAGAPVRRESLPEPSVDVEDAGEPLEEPDDESRAAVAFARRVVAGLADLVILALVGAVELAAGAFLLDLRFPPVSLLGLAAFLGLAAVVLLVLAPFVWGTTPGMALADLRVRAADGGSPTLVASALRLVGFVLTGALAGVPLLIAAFDRRGRTLADLLSRTTVAPAERRGDTASA